MQGNKHLILKCIVGSKAHGLATAKSDTDYRGVFVLPTSEILSLGNTKQRTVWNEGNDDETYWEIGHFLNLATSCNPTILETFAAPVESATVDGIEMRQLLPYIWDPKRVRDAFIGYGVNQRKKFLEEKDARSGKYAVAYLRTLIQAKILLDDGELIVDMSDESKVSQGHFKLLKKWKSWTQDDIDYGEVISHCKTMEAAVNDSYNFHMVRRHPQQPNLEKVNKFLLSIRQKNW